MQKFLTAIVVGITALFAAAHAAPVTFTYEGSGSGRIGNDGFQTLFTITATADTDNIMAFADGFFVAHDTVVIEIVDIGVYNIISPSLTFVNTAENVVGFATGTGNDLFNVGPDGSFNTYDLSTDFGPINGAGQLRNWIGAMMQTNDGILIFEESFTDARFTAEVGEIPLPGAAFLFLPALGGLMVWKRKKA